MGAHVVEFRRRCHETARRTLEVSEPRDYDARPGPAGRVAGHLCSLRSDPPGARIFVDGESMGVTPRDLDARVLRPAPHRGQARGRQVHPGGDAGEGRGAHARLPDPAQPGLPGRGRRERRGRAPGGGGRGAHHCRTWPAWPALNFVPAPRETVDHILSAGAADAPRAGPRPGLRRRPHPQGHREAGRRRSRCRASWWPCCRKRSCTARPCCTCWRRATPMADQLERQLRRVRRSYLRFLARAGPAGRPSTGPGAASSPSTRSCTRACPCCGVVAGRPAAQAGVQPGEVVEAVDGKPVKQHRRPG